MIDPLKPPIRITPHDRVRLEVVQELTRLMASCLTLPFQHEGHMHDMLDIALGIAKVIDGMYYESAEFSAWADKHARVNYAAALLLAVAARKGDRDRAAKIAQQLVYEHPLPVTVVDSNCERVK